MSEPVEGVVVSTPGQVRELTESEKRFASFLIEVQFIRDSWKSSAEERRKLAERSALFGPRMMIMAAEAQMLADCAHELDAALKSLDPEGGTG